MAEIKSSSFSFPPFASSSRFPTPVRPSTRWTAGYKEDKPCEELLRERTEPGSQEEIPREVVHREVADEEPGSLQLLKVNNDHTNNLSEPGR